MTPINPDGTISKDSLGSLLERMRVGVGELFANRFKAVTAALATLLIAFAVAVACWQIASGWLFLSPVVPITFMAGLVAAQLVTEARWS